MNLRLSKLAKALRDNGLPQAKKNYFQNVAGNDLVSGLSTNKFDLDDIHAACAIGQIGVNINALPMKIRNALDDIPWRGETLIDEDGEDFVSWSVADVVINYNDEQGKSFTEIADWLDTVAEKLHDPVLSIPISKKYYTTT